MLIAREARKEADSFENDIVLAKKQATDAEAHLKESLRQAAEANKEATAARLELDRLRTPRTLSSEQQRKIAEALKPFSGTEFILEVNPVPEAINLAGLIANSLIASGWKWKKIERFGIPTVSVADNVTAIVLYRAGLTVALRPPTSTAIRSADALVTVLERQRIGPVSTGQLPSATFPYVSTGVVVVMVGSKP